jgi:hypothetical protein
MFFMGGACAGAFGLAGSLCGRFANRVCFRPFVWRHQGGLLKSFTKEIRMNHTTPLPNLPVYKAPNETPEATEQEIIKTIQHAQNYNHHVRAMLSQVMNVFDGLDRVDAEELFAMNTLCLCGVKDCLENVTYLDKTLDHALVALKGKEGAA